MTFVTRIRGIFGGYVNGIVSSLENPEESMKEAIRHTEKHLRKAQIQLERIRRAGDTLNKNYEQAQNAVGVWVGRAKKYKEQGNTEKAKQCLVRKRHEETRAETLERQIKEHVHVHDRIEKQIASIKQRREDLQARYEMYLAKKSTCLAAKASADGLSVLESFPCEEIFQRFEESLSELELEVGQFETSEMRFEQEITAEEEEDSLDEELNSL